ncbi:MAG: hypothetical protein KDA96_04120 [Planctomycetaceae bacterium]|nr:hypothetical protein [Planctomycetaceae bacterium]
MTEPGAITSFLMVHVFQFSIVLLFAGLTVRIVGRRWPQLAFLVCMLAFVKCLTPPVLTSPAGLFTRSEVISNSTPLRLFSADELIRRKQLERRFSFRTGPQVADFVASADMEEEQDTQWSADGGPISIVPEDSGERNSSISYQSVANSLSASPFLLTAILFVWFAGACGVVILSVKQWAQLRQWARQAFPAEPDSLLNQLVTETSSEVGLRRTVRLLISPDNVGPLLLGITKPVLILPEQLVTVSEQEKLKPVIAHELAHARRGDILWGLLQYVAQVIWWFHPMVWWIGRSAHIVCERCCDDEAIASIRCTAAEYARGLIRVLELRNLLRTMPRVPAIRSSEINSQRLERIMRYCGRCYRRTPGLMWTIAVLLGVAVLPGALWIHAQEEARQAEIPIAELHERIGQAMMQKKWDNAAELLRQVVEKNPGDGRAQLLLGYALHAGGYLDDALIEHEKATQFPAVRPIATYNVACALCRTGDLEGSLKRLEEAIRFGFRHSTDLGDDPDFAALRGDPRFEKMRKSSLQTPADSPLRQLDFWLGEWDVHDAEGALIGQNSITLHENGHLIRESWRNTKGATGTSINFLAPTSKEWTQVWVDGSGSVVQYTGTVADGKLDMTGTATNAAGVVTHMRMTLQQQPDGRLRQKIEQSVHGNDDWITFFDGVYTRQLTPNEAESADTITRSD